MCSDSKWKRVTCQCTRPFSTPASSNLLNKLTVFCSHLVLALIVLIKALTVLIKALIELIKAPIVVIKALMEVIKALMELIKAFILLIKAHSAYKQLYCL